MKPYIKLKNFTLRIECCWLARPNAYCAVYNRKCVVYSVLCTVCCVQCVVCSVLCTVCCVQCVVYSVHYMA